MTAAAMQDKKSIMNQDKQNLQNAESINQLPDESIHKLLTTALGRIFQHIDLTFDQMYQVMLVICLA